MPGGSEDDADYLGGGLKFVMGPSCLCPLDWPQREPEEFGGLLQALWRQMISSLSVWNPSFSTVIWRG